MTTEAHDSHFINSFQPLVYKTLSRLNISQANPDFEDCVQELTVHLLKLRELFHEDIFKSDKNRFKFTAYAAKGLYWFGLNLIRYSNKEYSYASTAEDIEYFSEKYNNEIKSTTKLHIKDFFIQAKKRLSEEDYQLLIYISEGVYTSTEIAKLLNVSRSTVYDRKYKIQARLEDLRDYLSD